MPRKKTITTKAKSTTTKSKLGTKRNIKSKTTRNARGRLDSTTTSLPYIDCLHSSSRFCQSDKILDWFIKILFVIWLLLAIFIVFF